MRTFKMLLLVLVALLSGAVSQDSPVVGTTTSTDLSAGETISSETDSISEPSDTSEAPTSAPTMTHMDDLTPSPSVSEVGVTDDEAGEDDAGNEDVDANDTDGAVSMWGKKGGAGISAFGGALAVGALGAAVLGLL